MKPTRKRKFDGKTYKSTSRFTSKLDANNVAENARKRGNRARVVRVSNIGYKWRVYIRKGTRG